MEPYSVVITHFQREKNLLNTLEGLNRQSEPPFEVIVVEMGTGIVIEEVFQYKLRIVNLPMVWDQMPLAAARNYGAETCATGQLIFLDVDCIPATDFCKKIVGLSFNKKALVMGTPRYMLHNNISDGFIDNLEIESVSHPARPNVKNWREENCYEMFWSLCFGLPVETYLHIGGFDENYKGYGAEDTDFALETKHAGVPFYLSDAKVYHQQHPVYVPPLNHMRSIIGNCNLFFSKWGYWPMGSCLREFADLGFIEWNPEQDVPVSVLKNPSKSEIMNTLVEHKPYR